MTCWAETPRPRGCDQSLGQTEQWPRWRGVEWWGVPVCWGQGSGGHGPRRRGLRSGNDAPWQSGPMALARAASCTAVPLKAKPAVSPMSAGIQLGRLRPTGAALRIVRPGEAGRGRPPIGHRLEGLCQGGGGRPGLLAQPGPRPGWVSAISARVSFLLGAMASLVRGQPGTVLNVPSPSEWALGSPGTPLHLSGRHGGP